MTNNYLPRKKNAEILRRALELVHSVDYSVSARWLFYRLLQEGFYSKKDDYKYKWLPAVSSARHAEYGGWYPDTLSDDTREGVIRGRGAADVQSWLNMVAERVVCNLDKWYNQENYVEIWFEARAMAEQFKHYTKYITLRPMAGQASIPFKYEIARDLDAVASRYGKPVTILYFGDLDPAGSTIAEVVERDVRKWCGVDFRFSNCGLTKAQAAEWSIPENPDKPGQFQWEALSDLGAKKIIQESTKPFISHAAFSDIEDMEKKVTRRARREWLDIAEAW